LKGPGVKWFFAGLATLALVAFSAPGVQLYDSTGAGLTFVNGAIPVTSASSSPSFNATIGAASTSNAIATGPGLLSSAVVTTAGTTGTFTCYDGLTATGTVIAGITATNGATQYYAQTFNIPFRIGLSCVSATAGPAVTIGYIP
jgi:hypothetical protein